MADTGAEPRILLDRYELRQQVGRGGMGTVWLGHDRRLQRDVAVKVLLPQLSEEPSFRQRLAVEARAAAALDHPNVVEVYDIDEDDGVAFIVMERLPGPSLDHRLTQGPMTEDEVRRVATDLLSGLAAAHAHNVVHRDIKPGNLIRSAGGRWKVGDFGLAKDLSSVAHLTLAGVAVGTPAYLAPEQLDGRPATPATDLWAAAVVLREALTGRRPFDGDDPIAVAHAVLSTRLPSLAVERPDVDPALAGAIDRALAFDPLARFATARDMLAAIEGRVVPGVPVHPAVPVAPPVVPGAPDPLLAPGPEPTALPAEDPAARASRRAWLIVAVAAVAALAVLAVLLGAAAFMEEEQGDDAPGSTPDQPALTTAPPNTTPTNAPATNAPATNPPPAGEGFPDQDDVPDDEAPPERSRPGLGSWGPGP